MRRIVALLAALVLPLLFLGPLPTAFGDEPGTAGTDELYDIVVERDIPITMRDGRVL